MKKLFVIWLSLYSSSLYAQLDSRNFAFRAYGEFYYSYDFSQPQHHEKPNFVYNHKRHNELSANLILLRGQYANKKQRANLGLMAGDYAHYNLSSEPTWAQIVYEANIGVKLSNKQNIWLDVGIMPSHIGFESAISADCWTLTRSILAENSPYYESGIKLGYTHKNELLNAAVYLLNGWQRIQKPDYFQLPALGMQVNYKLKGKLFLNYSNFIGSVKPDSLRALRTFHNFYLQYEPAGKLGLIFGVDIGTDKYNLKNYAVWYSPIAILRYQLHKRFILALRGEYYDDRKQILINTNSIHGFQVYGCSTNLDYKISNQASFRVEGKLLQAKDAIFDVKSKNNSSLTTNLTIKL